MSKVMQNIAILSSALRTLLAAVVVGALGWAGWYGFKTYNADHSALAKAEQDLAETRFELEKANEELKKKDQAIADLQTEVARLDTAMRLLKVDHRVARLTVLDQATEPDTKTTLTRLEFQELDDQGQPLEEPKQFTIPGDVVYIDSWIVKFDDKYVEQADLHRATSLVLFRRVFGEHQKPLDGIMLDEIGGRPKAYGRDREMSDFEQKIWSDFWSVANDESKQVELGIRAAHGEAPSMKVQEGKSYRVELRASGGLTITPEPETSTPRQPPST